ncbi:DUF2637 domain-containing protein [Streptomyces mirabilis]|uniref:DUF2637 domain-containing protein n=1 Tax=Streptomyces mirabilis TaxID=68239 RepID=UPI00224F3DC0|nr:DUF2637 domain-containing protein [Streptomyces mirabilis]MCX4429617.1 DUF2637 domain-containing protein [Streptomyces mirabilis]
MQKFLVGVVVGGAVVIAGIGFAGSYAAVRELALKKGFGNFAYVFPIGIDAGICVLLALDLLLTWIRIPFPLLRQTAWLLTVATIAFNGAAAWPNPLGVGMHAVIPVLFVVLVEAARHAIGRIADITADKHMEGVRLTRWLLSPIPTFLLWRRMKLWELRSYEQVIKLEQDRLVYQARLHSRFGRAWRRKAPVESMMPLRLARYGVPLAETAPSGLAAAGIEPALLFPAPVQVATPAPAPAAPEHRELEPSAAPEEEFQPQKEAVEEGAGHFAEAYQRWIAQVQAEPTASQFAAFLRSEYGITTAAGGPLSDEQLQPLLRVLQHRYAPPADPAIAPDGVLEEEPSWEEFFYSAWLAYAGEHDQYPDAAALAAYVFQRDGITGATGQPLTGEDLEDFVAAFQEREFGDAEPPVKEAVAGSGEQLPPVPSPSASDPQAKPVGAGAHAAEEKRGPKVNAAIDGLADEQIPPQPPAEASGLTTVDRYYLAWAEYQQQHGAEPNGDDLSKYLGEKGVVGRNRRAAAASTLRRYLLPFRIYSVWAEHRVRSEQPSLKAVAEACAARGITLQYNEPITAATIAEHTADFERRWHAVIRPRTDAAAQSR